MSLAFGLVMPIVARGLPAGRLLHELVAEAQEAERAGFDLIWVSEHHQGPRGSLTDPITVAAWLLARTDRIKVGTGVLLAPLHHPVRLAEQAAILQEASLGRFVLGLGAGYQQVDFTMFGRDRDHRRDALEATVEVLRKAWSGDRVAGYKVAPQSQGAPPPIWLGAWSRWGVRAAARWAEGWIADPIRTEAEVEEMASWYGAAAAAAGVRARIHLMRHLWVGADAENARHQYAPYVEPVYRYHLKGGALGERQDLEADDIAISRALDRLVICGSPAEVSNRVAGFMERTGAEGCSFALRHPAGPSHEAVANAIRLLGAEVLPVLRARIRAA